MVIYYSWSGNTKLYGEQLAQTLGQPAFALEEKRPGKMGKMAFYARCLQTMLKLPSRVKVMPDLTDAKELYICSPIWGSGPAPVVRYFLKHADLAGRKVNFLFTYGGMTGADVIRSGVPGLLNGKDCRMGSVHCFEAKIKQPPEPEKVRRGIEAAYVTAG